MSMQDELGELLTGEIRNNSFNIAFETGNDDDLYDYCIVKIEDLMLVEDFHFTDEQILTALPKNDPRWWCKVENGFILNLLGEKKNKVPYDYNS